MRFPKRFFLFICLLMGFPVYAQTARPQAAFLPYLCEFQRETNTATIHAVLTGADGLPMPNSSYTMNIQVEGESIPAERITTTPVTGRNPLRLILVLDVTDTVPLLEIISAISTKLAPQLEVNDELALITVGNQISGLTQFYTDKIRLVNEHILGLRLQEGDNRVYDAIYEAVSSFQPSTVSRQAVLVITDSGRRNQEQTSIEDIITRAQASNVEIYSIGFNYEDRPDTNDLITMSNATNGHVWIYNGTEQSRMAIGNAVSDYLDQFINTLDSEVSIAVEMQGQIPDASGFVNFTITVDSNNDVTLVEEITCPIQAIDHSIAFTALPESEIITEPVEIKVQVDSDLRIDQTRIVYRLNDEIVQNSITTSYTLDPTRLEPGLYTLSAFLRDRSDQNLASTPTINLFVQKPLELNTIDGETANLSGEVRFEAITLPGVSLPNVQFEISNTSRPDLAYPLGSASFQNNGRAILTVQDIQAEVRRLFPDYSSEDTFQIRAFVEGEIFQRPYAQSPLLSISVGSPNIAPPVALPTITQLPTITLPQDPLFVPVAITVGLFAFNLLLLRHVNRARIRRLIRVPDDVELSDRLMTITVRRGNSYRAHILTKKTMLVGRGSVNDINLGDDPRISRQHGAVIWRKGRWYYTNRKRGIKTRVNGKRNHDYKLIRLEPITEIEIGDAVLIFHSNAQQDIADLTRTNL